MVAVTGGPIPARSPVSRSARISLLTALGVTAGLVATWFAAPDDYAVWLILFVPGGVAVIAGLAAIPGLFGRLRDARWPFAALLPVNAIALVFLAVLLSSDALRRDLGAFLWSFLVLDLVAVAVLVLAVAGPRNRRPVARRWGMLAAALGCAGFVLGALMSIAAALS